MVANALVDRPAPVEERIVDAALECIARCGVAKTTADDIARAAGVSRATLYRAFPGGKDVAFEAVLRRETQRFFDTVADRLAGASTLEDAAVIGLLEAAGFLTGHDALGFVIAHEPERVLPALAFHRLDGALAVATAATAPHLRRFLPDDRSAVTGAEWLVRLLLTYVLDPTPTVDLRDPHHVRRLVRTYVVPALTAPVPTVPSPPQEH